MSIKKALFAVTLVAIVATTGTVFAQVDDDDEDAAEAVAPPPPPPPPPARPAPIPVYQVPAPDAAAPGAKAGEKSEPKVGFYGTASYRFRGRILTESGKAYRVGDAGTSLTEDGKTAFDYINLLGWSAGLKAKVDDQLSLQFQIGNDLTSGEEVNWTSNNLPGSKNNGRAAFQNLYVHLAYATWNPGPISLTGGVIPVTSNGTLDLLERSLSTNKYDEAIFQTWSTQLNNSLVALRLGVPFVSSDEVKFGAELTTSVIEGTVRNNGYDILHTGKHVNDTVYSNSKSVLLILDLPLAAGDFKITPEVTTVLFRNNNKYLETYDHEFLVGMSLGYKVNPAFALSAHTGYGTVSNNNSGIINAVRNADNTKDSIPAVEWGEVGQIGDIDSGLTFIPKVNNGLILGVGATVAAGPGSFAFDFKYGSSWNSETVRYSDGYKDDLSPDGKKDRQLDDRNDILLDLSYGWNVHPKFQIKPRWRLFYSSWGNRKNGEYISSRMENRPEIILTGTF